MSKKIVITPIDKRAFTKTVDQILKEFAFFRVSRIGGWKENVLKIGIQPIDRLSPNFDDASAQSRYVHLSDKINDLSNTKKCERIILEQGVHRLAGLEIITTRLNKPKKKVVSN